ncbi:hypothetical protein [Nitrincola sp.]|uniref:hypothetical protein n=1 Tax=Nitrincola sp. TaxID=1926584 RepID=UPI003A916952
MKHMILITMFIILILSGCTKPRLYPAFMDYSKPGVDLLGVKKAMLECGAVSVRPTQHSYEAVGLYEIDERSNHHFLVVLCMEREGFEYRHGTVEQACLRGSRMHFSACQPNPPIPERSIETRLNSHHCKVLSVTPAHCLP